MPDNEEVAGVMLEMIRSYVGTDVVDMLQNFNDAGPQGVALTNSLLVQPKILGKYSRMTPYVMQYVRSMQSAQRSTSSIGGKMQTAVLVKKVMQYQAGVYTENQDAKKTNSTFNFGGGDNQNKKPGSQQSGLL